MKTAAELSQDVGTKPACEALQIPRATFYRHRHYPKTPGNSTRPAPPLSLTQIERQKVVDILNSERFQDKAPYEIYATLLDDGVYHCSIRTMYRILKDVNGKVKERRKWHQQNHYQKPELLATASNQVWSWDITKLKGPVKWTYYYLHVILDIFSRYVVGWMIAPAESAGLP